MQKTLFVPSFAVLSLLLVSVAFAQSGGSPTITLSSNEVSFFNGDADSIQATIKNNDDDTHVFTISVFPGTLDKVYASTSLGHVTLVPGESVAIRAEFSSLFDAEFLPREFAITVAASDDKSITATKDIVVNILRRSPVYVLSLGTNKFTYYPGETVNISSVVANQGGDSFDEFKMQTVITKDGEFVRRFETPISFLSEKSRNGFSSYYTFDQFAQPGIYSAELILKDDEGQTLSKKSLNFRVESVSKASQQESTSYGLMETTTTITSTNEGNSPTDIRITAIIPSFTHQIFVSDIEPASVEEVGNSVRVNWLFSSVAAGEAKQVIYKFSLWKIWLTVVIIGAIVVLAFKFVFTVKIIKKSRYMGGITKESEVPVTIEVVNRSMNEVRDVYVRDFIPPIAKIVPKFETMKPTIRETVGGTEITWKLDSLRAGEERVMSYRIKPKMDIMGSLKLNPATVDYSTRKRQKKSAASALVVVQTGQ